MLYVLGLMTPIPKIRHKFLRSLSPPNYLVWGSREIGGVYGKYLPGYRARRGSREIFAVLN